MKPQVERSEAPENPDQQSEGKGGRENCRPPQRREHQKNQRAGISEKSRNGKSWAAVRAHWTLRLSGAGFRIGDTYNKLHWLISWGRLREKQNTKNTKRQNKSKDLSRCGATVVSDKLSNRFRKVYIKHFLSNWRSISSLRCLWSCFSFGSVCLRGWSLFLSHQTGPSSASWPRSPEPRRSGCRRSPRSTGRAPGSARSRSTSTIRRSPWTAQRNRGKKVMNCTEQSYSRCSTETTSD